MKTLGKIIIFVVMSIALVCASTCISPLDAYSLTGILLFLAAMGILVFSNPEKREI